MGRKESNQTNKLFCSCFSLDVRKIIVVALQDPMWFGLERGWILELWNKLLLSLNSVICVLW